MGESGGRVLFCAESFFQLMNVITLRMTEREARECDLVLSHATEWEPEMLDRIRQSGLFQNIYQPNTHDLEWDFWDLSLEERKTIYANPQMFFQKEQLVPPIYDELFIPLDHLYWKMLYHLELTSGKRPAIYMYDEGLRAYTMDLLSTDEKPYAVNAYPEAPFLSAIRGYYLHMPELYALSNYPYELLQIPNPLENAAVKATLTAIFGYEEAPKEPYIYIEDFFFADHYVTNDFELFKMLAEEVGQENVIVKRHPRDKYDRFEPMGFKTTHQNKVPWEIQLMTNDYCHKVLVSVSSTAILTPYLIFDQDIHVISLEKMFFGENPTHKDKAYKRFISSVVQYANREKVHIHVPRNQEELREMLRFIRLDQNKM